jgi:gluconolactonase
MKNMNKFFLVSALLLQANGVVFGQAKKGYVEKLDPALDAIINTNAKVEIIADSLDWSEGPLWIEQQKMLLFSDVPQNIIYKWTEKKGRQIYLSPSGYTGKVPRGGEKGSNGLALSRDGQLIICQDGDRRVSVMNAPINKPSAVFRVLTGNYQGKKFNSPNDLVYNSNGDLFFTDPPYGLEKNMDDPLKELRFQGVYKIKKSGALVLLLDSITRPNGIAITPDQKSLIIANSDPEKPYWYAYDFGKGDALVHPRIFYDATAASKKEAGMPDGLKIDSKGNVYATGPGGLWIFNSKGKLLGKIKFNGLVSNCSLTADEKTIYLTADDYVLRVKMRN